MNEKAIIYIIYFTMMSFCSKWFNGWILFKIYDSANLKFEDVIRKREELKASNNQSRKLTKWIISRSPKPKITKKLFILYNTTSLPSLICLNLSIVSLFTNIFDKFLEYSCFAVFLITFFMILLGISQNKK